MAPKKTRGLALRIQRQQVKDPHNFRFDYRKKQICNVVCFNPFKVFFFFKEIEECEGKQQIDFSQEIKKDVHILS
jgi:hypothetical protein